MTVPKKTIVFRDIPVSRQGQITLPKSIRDHWGIQQGRALVTLIFNDSDEITVKPQPKAEALCGVFKKYTVGVKPADMYELREEFEGERLRELGYCKKDD